MNPGLFDGARRARGAACAALVAAVSVGACLAADRPLDTIPGYVDGAPFLRLAGDEAVSVEVNLHGSLLKALLKVDEELFRLAGGLESIHAVILNLSDGDERRRAMLGQLRDAVAATEQRLIRTGWERVATVKDPKSVSKVLVLNDQDAIHGLVVMVVGEEEVIFANLAGVLDLAAIERIGQRFDLPGLDQMRGREDK